MGKLFLLTLLSSGIVLGANAEELKVKSKVKEVTVFFSGAEVTHESKTQLQKGSNAIIIQGLSPYIDVNSIRIKTNDGVFVSSFEFMIEPQDKDGELKQIQDTIDNYRAEILQIQSNLKVNESFLQMLQKSVDKTVAGGEDGLGIEDLIKTMDYYDKKIKETEKSSFSLKAEEKRISTEITKVNARAAEYNQKDRKDKGALKLTVSSAAATQCTFNVVYYTHAASWTPFHDINVLNVDSPIKITSKAKVNQITGTDWEQVKLKLSTSVPTFGKIAPLFSAWILQEPNIISHRIRPNLAQNALSYSINDEKVSEVGDFIETKSHVVLTENTINVTYDIDLPYTIPGNGNMQNIDLLTQEIKAEYKYYCAPRLDPNTFLIAEIHNWEKLNLLSGMANITYDGTYTGETYIDATTTKDALGLTLGVDRRVAVKREKINEMSSTKFLGSDTKQDISYRLTVRNNNNKPINLVLKDQYPISNQKQVEVTLSKDITPPSFNKEEVGVLTWEHEVAAGESKTYIISYSVKYPKSMSFNL